MAGEDLLAETLKSRSHRFVAAGVDPNDLERIVDRVGTWDDWCPAWEASGAAYEDQASRARQDGFLVTAGEALARAALHHHFGQFLWYHDREAKRRVQARKEAAYRAAAPHLTPPARRLEIPFDGVALPGFLRVPPGVRRAPCVLLTPGADSTKEEFFRLEEAFLARGLATFSFDGPGQGEMWARMKLRPDYEAAVGAIVDALTAVPDVDGGRLGIWGRSLGGYLAPRAAALDGRLRACISVGGLYDLGSAWDIYPPSLRQTLQFVWDAPTESAARAMAREYTLESVLPRLAVPLLLVHSGQDAFFSAEHAERMRQEAGDRATLVVFPEGTHACDNIPTQVRPLMADWMARQLGAAG